MMEGMTRPSIAQMLLIQEITRAATDAQSATKQLEVGEFIRLIRGELGISQTILAKRAGVPQSTISRLERGLSIANLKTLMKVFDALFCDLVIIPKLRKSIDTIRREQAEKKAREHIEYLRGTMNLEEQSPDPEFFRMLLKEEEDNYLHASSSKLWSPSEF